MGGFLIASLGATITAQAGHCERSEAIQNCVRAFWIASLRSQ
jgi:hypothetical protein